MLGERGEEKEKAKDTKDTEKGEGQVGCWDDDLLLMHGMSSPPVGTASATSGGRNDIRISLIEWESHLRSRYEAYHAVGPAGGKRWLEAFLDRIRLGIPGAEIRLEESRALEEWESWEEACSEAREEMHRWEEKKANEAARIEAEDAAYRAQLLEAERLEGVRREREKEEAEAEARRVKEAAAAWEGRKILIPLD